MGDPRHIFNPLEVCDFTQHPAFSDDWDRLGLTAEDLRHLEIAIMAYPKGPPVVRGTGGLRKLRYSPEGWGKGKRGALRACYVYFDFCRMVYLLLVYPKNEMDDLSPAGKRAIKQLIERFEVQLKRPRR